MSQEYILKAENISVEINDNKIIKNCSLNLKPGEFVGIIGSNGAGKSTFLKAIRGIIPRKTGQVEIFSRAMDDLEEKEIARQLAFMQQDVSVGFGFTAKEIVMTARYPYLAWWENESPNDEEVVERSMAFTGVLHLADKVIQQVSGGERQRILLAKIMAQETPIIFLDEPTASLDLMYQEEIFRYCKTLSEQGKSIVMICHDLPISAKFCSRLVLISKGEILAEGTPVEVLTEKNIAKSYGISSVVYHNYISGGLDLHTYAEAKVSSNKKVFISGGTFETGNLLRLLYEAGYDVSLGIVPKYSLLAELAQVFKISMIETPPFLIPSSKTLEICCQEAAQVDTVIFYGLPTLAEWNIYGEVLKNAKQVYFSSDEEGMQEALTLGMNFPKHWQDLPLEDIMKLISEAKL